MNTIDMEILRKLPEEQLKQIGVNKIFNKEVAFILKSFCISKFNDLLENADFVLEKFEDIPSVYYDFYESMKKLGYKPLNYKFVREIDYSIQGMQDMKSLSNATHHSTEKKLDCSNVESDIFNFKEVPEKYKKYVAIGIAEETRQQLAHSTPTKNRLIATLTTQNHQIKRKTPNYKLRYFAHLPKITVPLDNDDIINYIIEKNDIDIVFCLDDKFIREFYESILKAILTTNCTTEKKIKAINYIFLINYNVQESNLDGDTYDDDFSANAK